MRRSVMKREYPTAEDMTKVLQHLKNNWNKVLFEFYIKKTKKNLCMVLTVPYFPNSYTFTYLKATLENVFKCFVNLNGKQTSNFEISFRNEQKEDNSHFTITITFTHYFCPHPKFTQIEFGPPFNIIVLNDTIGDEKITLIERGGNEVSLAPIIEFDGGYPN